MRYAFVGQSLGILLSMLLSRSAFGTLYLKHLGASDAATMWILSVPALMPLIQIPLSLFVNPKNAKVFLVIGWTLFGVFMSLAALAPSMTVTVESAYPLAIVFIVLALMCSMAGTTFWFPLLHDVIPQTHRGRFFGKLRATWSTLLYLSILLSGLYLGKKPDTHHFQIVMFVGVALVFLRSLIISRIPTVDHSTSQKAQNKNPLPFIKRIIETPPLRRFLVYYTVFSCSAGFLGHPLVLYMRDRGFNPRDNIIVFGFATLGMVLTLLFGGRMLDRLGARIVFKTVHGATVLLLTMVFAITWIQTDAIFPLMALSFVFSGASLALSNLACTTHLFTFVPNEGRIFYLTFVNLMLIVGASIASLITGTVLDWVGDQRFFQMAGRTVNIYQIILWAAAMSALLSTFLFPRIDQEKTM